jgi:hypothetical protein
MVFICVFLWSEGGADDTGRPCAGIEENDPGSHAKCTDSTMGPDNGFAIPGSLRAAAPPHGIDRHR